MGVNFLFFTLQVDEQKEDFSDLPPNQRKKRLLGKIDSINRDITRETAER